MTTTLKQIEMSTLYIVIFLLIFLFLYNRYKTFKYYVKFTLYYGYIMFVCFWASLTALITSGGRRTTENSRYLIWGMIWAKRLFGMKVEVKGREHLHSELPMVVVLNHQSALDMMVLSEVWDWKSRMTVISKRSVLYAGTAGLMAYLCDVVFVDRYDHTKAVQQMNKTVNRITSERLKVFVYPEGTRNHDGSMLPFKKGAFHIAVQAQVPIVPLVTASFENFYIKPEKKFETGKIRITCLPPISTEGKTREDIPELLEEVRNKMIQCFEETSKNLK